MTSRSKGEPYEQLIWALRFFVVIHLVAIGSIVFLVQPGFDQTLPLAERAMYVADHSMRWRLGWLPWQLSALSDVMVSVTLIRWLRARLSTTPLKWAYVGLAFNLIASIPEQISEWVLVSSHVDLAGRATGSPDLLVTFGDNQRTILAVTSIFSSVVYLFMNIAWQKALTAERGVGLFDGFAGLVLASATALLAVSTVMITIQTMDLANVSLLIALTAGPAFLLVCLWGVVAGGLAASA